MRISDWSSDVCSSDLAARALGVAGAGGTRDHLAFLDRGHPISEQGLSVEDLLEITSQLHLEAVAPEARAHVQIGSLRRLGRLLLAACARRIETEAKQCDRRYDTQLLGAQLLVGTELRPLRRQIEQGRTLSIRRLVDVATVSGRRSCLSLRVL